MGRIDARSRAPQVALAVLGGWAIVLVLSGSFGQLLNYTTVGEWLFHAFGIATLFWYRRRFAAEPAPYRVPFYPVLPFLFVLTVLGVIAATTIDSPGDAGMKGYAWNAGANYRGQGYGNGNGYVPPQRNTSGPDPYTVLGIGRDVDDRAVKRAYRKLISEHHPDRLGDLPEDMRKRAEARASEINAAYERIKAERGFK